MLHAGLSQPRSLHIVPPIKIFSKEEDKTQEHDKVKNENVKNIEWADPTNIYGHFYTEKIPKAYETTAPETKHTKNTVLCIN